MKGYQYHYPKEKNSEAFYLCMEDLAFNDLERSCLKQNVLFYNTPAPPKPCRPVGRAQELTGTCTVAPVLLPVAY